MTNDAHLDTDVTVVGAGPVGLMLAAELALSGATVQVLERLAEPAVEMKAGGINVSTAEALDRRGLLPAVEMKAGGINVSTAEALDRRGLLPAAEKVQRELLERLGPPAPVPGKRRSEGDGPDGGRRGEDDQQPGGRRLTGHFAGIVLDADLVNWTDPDLAAHASVDGARMVPQRELEALLAEHLAALGVPVRRGVEVTSFEDTGDGVLIDTSTAGASGTVRTGWLVGCDGGHSTVRRLAGIDFPGTDPELTGYRALADIADPSVLAEGWGWSPHGVYRYGPQPGLVVAVEFVPPPADRSAPVTLEELQASLRRVSGTDVTLTGLRGDATRWSDNARQAATYRSGRVLLAGDSAHVHSPFGGQGLNLGFGDAMNLGWKLGAVVAGRAPEELLDTYDAERRPVGAWVLDWTRAQIGVLRGDAKSAALRELLIDLLHTRDGATHAVKKILGVTQRVDLPGDHRLTGRYAPDLWLSDGSRLTDHGHGGGFLLLDRTPDGSFTRLAKPWDDRVNTVPDDTHATPAAVLVRPDGVVAWATDSADSTDATAADGLEAALRRWAGPPSS
ncbi:FAD-dependent oxidoreductase [Streptomyces sp. NPDC050617]|uniref:FAD-dependent oxidoreductase n=1 Tax=Streptomyces sp. NPDC050617 TaxID=3154628 RepID=UPI00343B6AB2